MELKQLITVMKRWSWFLALGLLVGAVGGFMLSKVLTPTYEAKTKILIARTQQQKNSDTVYSNEQQYLDTYIELLQTGPVVDAASSALGFKIDETKVQVKQVRTTQLVQVSVQDSNPKRAADIANALVTSLLEQKEILDSSRYAVTEQVLQAQVNEAQQQLSTLQNQLNQTQTADVQGQLKQVEAQITSLHEQIAKLETEISDLTPPVTQLEQTQLMQKQSQVSQIQSILYLYEQIRANLIFVGKPIQSGTGLQEPQLVQLQSTLNLYQQIYLNLLNNLESLRLSNMQNTPTISQVEPAIPQKAPIRPLPSIYTMLAALVGLIITAGSAFLIEHFDDRLKSAEEIERLFDVPVIGSILDTPRINQPGGEIYSVSNPNTPTAEALRMLRMSFNFVKAGKPLKTLAVLSPGAKDGKTTVAANLAALFAQGGKHVTLVDANLRQPQLHKVLGLQNLTGFSELLSGTAEIQTTNYSLGDGQGFDVLLGGSLPVNLAELLDAETIEHALTRIKKNSSIVIVDGPPLDFAEAQVLASKVDGVLLVMRPGVLTADALRASFAQLNRIGVHVVGLALNRVKDPRSIFVRYRNSRYLEGTTRRLIPLVKKMLNQKPAVHVQSQ